MGNPFSHLEDEKLMELYVQGNYEAFEVIYGRHKDKVYTYLSKRLTDKNSIEDVFQNIFIKFHKSKQNYNPKFTLMKWIYTISKSELLDHLKKKKVTEVEFKETDAPLSTEAEGERLDLSNEPGLNEKEKKAIDLKFYSDQDYDQISQTLNTSKANVRKIISRGLKKLRLKYSGGSYE